MKSNIGRFLALVVTVAGLTFVLFSAAAAGDIEVLAPGIKHFQKSYNELTGAWYNWATLFPFATNPIVENGSVDCTREQKGKIWFLAGNFGGTSVRTCTIPQGKALFFPVINTLWWVPEDGTNVAGLRSIANGGINATTFLQVIIDGVVVNDPFAYRAQSQPGGFALKFGPLLADFGFAPTPNPRDPAVADGYWILLAPLRKGDHVIQFRSRNLGNPDDSGDDFELDVTYHLTVGKVGDAREDEN